VEACVFLTSRAIFLASERDWKMLKHFLMATGCVVLVSVADTTTPYAPLPSRLTNTDR
jgi:hypothetical protein